MSRLEHHEYQLRLCFMCLKKCDPAPISQKNKDLLIKHVYPELNRDNTWLPQSLCTGCARKLSSEDSNTPRKIDNLPNYGDLARNVRDQRRVHSTRKGSGTPCECELCQRGSVSKFPT